MPSKLFTLGIFISFMLLFLGIIFEMKTHYLQSNIFHYLAKKLTYQISGYPGSSVFPQHGPLNQRRGYTEIPQIIQRLSEKGAIPDSQAVFSKAHKIWTESGLYPIYKDKSTAGLTLTDSQGDTIYNKTFPGFYYSHIDSIPTIIVQSLLYIENRGLLDSVHINMNPSVAWKRMANAGLEYVSNIVGKSKNVSGGSTLATQIEKFKYSRDGLTRNAKDKIIQILSSSARAYKNSQNTLRARKDIVRDYINSVPLSAISGYGEINGISEGLYAWYGMNIQMADSVLKLLQTKNESEISEGEWRAIGTCYRMVLNLFVAQRRPTYFLAQNPEALNKVVEEYLKLFLKNNIITKSIYEAAMHIEPKLNKQLKLNFPFNTVNKTAYSYRARLMSLLGVSNLYQLDRLDLDVTTTIDKKAQDKVIAHFNNLTNASFVSKSGYNSYRMLDRGNPEEVVYSLILYQKSKQKVNVKIFADNFPKPLNVNEGGKLDLGSTAKMRTLVHYLAIIQDVYSDYKTSGGTASSSGNYASTLQNWVERFIKENPMAESSDILRAALDRKFSANPQEKFFTGGGSHQFQNFDSKDNHKLLTVREAMQKSNNLVFIRIMREILKYHISKNPNHVILQNDMTFKKRQDYLDKFSVYEGRVFLSKYYHKYQGLNDSLIMVTLLGSFKPTPKRLVYLFHNFYPEKDSTAFVEFLEAHDLKFNLKNSTWENLFKKHKKEFNLSDLAYLLRMHPLEIWAARYLLNNKSTSRSVALDSAKPAILEVYQWLMKPKKKRLQDNRLWTMLEIEAFAQIHTFWKRLGYPFHNLVPSLATAIGSSADRPTSLAQLMGILVEGGIKSEHHHFKSLFFAQNTPYRTDIKMGISEGTRVLDSNVATVALECLGEVVEKGTAIRLKGVYKDSLNKPFSIGGKTGTGDNVFKVFGSGGKLKSKQVIGRTATFVFHINMNLFGVITASVQGENAANYGFTSSLPVQILKDLEPVLSDFL